MFVNGISKSPVLPPESASPIACGSPSLDHLESLKCGGCTLSTKRAKAAFLNGWIQLKGGCGCALSRFCFWRKLGSRSIAIDAQPGATPNHFRCQLLVNGKRTDNRVEVENLGREGVFLRNVDLVNPDAPVRALVENAMKPYKASEIRTTHLALARTLRKAGFVTHSSVPFSPGSGSGKDTYLSSVVKRAMNIEEFMPANVRGALSRIKLQLAPPESGGASSGTRFVPSFIGNFFGAGGSATRPAAPATAGADDGFVVVDEQEVVRRMEDMGEEAAVYELPLADLLTVIEHVRLEPPGEILFGCNPMFTQAPGEKR